MPKPYRITLIISILLTLAVFVHEYIYDPAVNYTVGDYLMDILFAGSLFTAIFWGITSGIYMLVKKIAGLFVKA